MERVATGTVSGPKLGAGRRIRRAHRQRDWAHIEWATVTDGVAEEKNRQTDTFNKKQIDEMTIRARRGVNVRKRQRRPGRGNAEEPRPGGTDSTTEGMKAHATTHPQQPPAPSSGCWLPAPYTPGALGALGWTPGRPVCCSCSSNEPQSKVGETGRREGTDLVVLPDLTDELAERLVDVDPLLR